MCTHYLLLMFGVLFGVCFPPTLATSNNAPATSSTLEAGYTNAQSFNTDEPVTEIDALTSDRKDFISPSNFLSTKQNKNSDHTEHSVITSTDQDDQSIKHDNFEQHSTNALDLDVSDINSQLNVSTTDKPLLLDSAPDNKSNTDTNNSAENLESNCAQCNHQEGSVSITGMRYTIENHTAFVHWDPLDETIKPCEFKYKLNVPSIDYVRYEHFAGNNFTATPCETYVVHLEASNACGAIANNSITIETLPGIIGNASITDAFLLSWDSPERSNCVTGYAVFINNTELINVTDAQKSLSYLPACQHYDIKIAPMSGQHFGPNYTFTAIKGPDEFISFNMSIKATVNNSIDIELLPNKSLGACAKSYNLSIMDLEESEAMNYFLEENTFSFKEAIPCGKYKVTATMFANYDESGVTSKAISKMVEMPSAPPKNVSIEVENVGTTFAELQLTLPTRSDYKCEVKNVIITCDQNYTNSIDIGEDNKVNMTRLLPFSKYECTGNILNADLNNFTVITIQAEPSEVRNVKISEINETSFKVSWDRPQEVPGILKQYEIRIEGAPNYEMPTETCKLDKVNLTKYYQVKSEYEIVPNASAHLLFDELPENYNYIITIRAETIKPGKGVTTTANTSVASPQSIKDLSYDIKLPEENKPVVHVSWEIPCGTFVGPEKIDILIETIEHLSLGRANNLTKIFALEMDSKQKLIGKQTYSRSIEPSSNYTMRFYVRNTELNLTSAPEAIRFSSPKGNTTAPIWVPLNLNDSQTDDQFTIEWEKPKIMFGNLINYVVNITLLGPLHSDHCSISRAHLAQPSIYSTAETRFTYQNSNSNHEYHIEITANTSEGLGSKDVRNYATKGHVSSPVRDLSYEIVVQKLECPYDVTVIITFEPPCELNGNLEHYLVTLFDQQGTNVSHVSINVYSHEFALNPETIYKVKVEVVTDYGRSIDTEIEFVSPAGIPEKPELQEHIVIVNNGATEMEIRLRNDYFNSSQGDIKYYAILVGVRSLWVDETDYDDWNSSGVWPHTGHWNENGAKYQATQAWWDPFNGTTGQVTFTLGTENCTNVHDYCNGPLKPKTEYFLAIRGLTNNGYRDSNRLRFVTLEDYAKTKNTVLIIGIVAGVVIVLLLIGFGVLYWKRRPNKKILDENKINRIITEEDGLLLPSLIKIEDFPSHYKKCEENLFLLKREYSNLAKVGENLDMSVAELPENRKKNRYINILPYDYTRVPLDCCSTDYINASFIKGYSGKVEYIATQGPLETTTADFWNMVIKENCSVVAMVAQFKEQNKIKCHKYFPENREQIELDNDDLGELTIRCSYEMNFEFYMERQIVVQTGDKQYTITHLQFLNWPDFGCPDGTANMLQFTLILRRHMEENNSKAVIHCSAGVGRTGTLIAVDMLLQTIRDGGDINIYETVTELRQQRQKMVQAEAQYLYIYKCINDAILRPLKLAEIKAIDPIYENLENVIEMKVFKNDNNNCNETIEHQPEQDKTNDNKELEQSNGTINNCNVSCTNLEEINETNKQIELNELNEEKEHNDTECTNHAG